MRILVLTRYGTLGSSTRYRFYQYFPFLRAAGHELNWLPFFPNDHVCGLSTGRRGSLLAIVSSFVRRVCALLCDHSADVIWLEKEVLPWLPFWLESALLRAKVPYVVDYDDATFHRYDMHSSPLIRRLLGRKIDHVMQRSAASIVGNEYLASRAYAAGARSVYVVPTVVDLNRYPPAPLPPDTVFTIGWIGSPSTARYIQGVAPALRAVCAAGCSRFLVVGAGPIHLHGVPAEIRTWQEATEGADLRDMHVGIMPLTDGPWERGKCGLKIVQYMASCRPVVVSPVGFNRELVMHGENGFQASSNDEWIEALQTLRSDRHLCLRMGAAGRALVERKLCLSITAPEILAILAAAARHNAEKHD